MMINYLCAYVSCELHEFILLALSPRPLSLCGESHRDATTARNPTVVS